MGKRKPTGRQLVWSKFWDSGVMAGEEEVYRFRGRFYYEELDSGYESGPHKSLRSLLKATGLGCLNEATVSISSPLYSAEELVAMMEVPDDLRFGFSLIINGEPWVCTAPGVLRRANENSSEAKP
jgi:hypothetical protein